MSEYVAFVSGPLSISGLNVSVASGASVSVPTAETSALVAVYFPGTQMNNIQIQIPVAYDLSGNAYDTLSVTQSGGSVLKVGVNSGDFAGASGLGVVIASGLNVLVSGQLTNQSGLGVLIASGIGVTDQSGLVLADSQPVNTSGMMYNASGVSLSGLAPTVIASMVGFDASGVGYLPLDVINSGIGSLSVALTSPLGSPINAQTLSNTTLVGSKTATTATVQLYAWDLSGVISRVLNTTNSGIGSLRVGVLSGDFAPNASGLYIASGVGVIIASGLQVVPPPGEQVSGAIIISGNVGQQGTWGVIASGNLGVSGTVQVQSGIVTAILQSGGFIASLSGLVLADSQLVNTSGSMIYNSSGGSLSGLALTTLSTMLAFDQSGAGYTPLWIINSGTGSLSVALTNAVGSPINAQSFSVATVAGSKQGLNTITQDTAWDLSGAIGRALWTLNSGLGVLRVGAQSGDFAGASGIGVIANSGLINWSQGQSGVGALMSGLAPSQMLIYDWSGETYLPAATISSGSTILGVSLKAPSIFRTAKPLPITGASGGQALTYSGSTAQFGSGAVIFTIKNMSGNAVAMVGASGVGTAPYLTSGASVASGVGYPLLGGETMTFEINNIQTVAAAFAPPSSGSVLAWFAIDR